MKNALVLASAALCAVLFLPLPFALAFIGGAGFALFAGRLLVGALTVVVSVAIAVYYAGAELIAALRTRAAATIGGLGALAAGVTAVMLLLAGPSYAADALAAPPIDSSGALALLGNIWAAVSTPAAVSGMIALAMAVLPQGAPGSKWDTVRTVLNIVASNWGNAKNQVKTS